MLHLDGGRGWGRVQQQVNLLMRALAPLTQTQLCLCPRGSALAERLRDERLPVRSLPWRGLGDPRAALAVARTVGRFDVVHCHDAGSLQVAILPAQLAHVPVVATRRARLRAMPPAWQLVDRIVVPWQAIAVRSRRRGGLEARLRIVPDGVSVEEIQGLAPLTPPLRRSVGVPADAFLLGGTATSNANAYDVVVKALELVQDAHAAILGEGPARARLERLGHTLGVTNRLHFLGGVPDVRRAFQEFDVFVGAAGDDEPAENVLHAMASGVPTVAADQGGSGEALAPVHATTRTSLFPPGDHATLAALLIGLRRNARRRRAIVRAQRIRLSDFTTERTAAAILAVYQEFL